MTHDLKRQQYSRDHIEQRGRQYYARLNIPKDIQAKHLFKTATGKVAKKFRQALGTTDPVRARLLAAPIVAEWQARLIDARDGQPAPLAPQVGRSPESWIAAYRTATPEQRVVLRELIEDAAAEEAGLPFAHVANNPEHATEQDRKEVDEYIAIATGERVAVVEHLDAYLKSKAREVEAKTLDQARSIIERFAAKFKYVRDVSRRAVQEYVTELAAEGASPQTIRRLRSQLRGYWSYLQEQQVVVEGPSPFDNPRPQKRGKSDRMTDRARRRQPFTPKDISRLIAEARQRDDSQLADVVTILAHTGMRLDELASMKLEQVRQGCFYVKEAGDGKSEAATRIIPVHSNLVALVKRLCQSSTDGFLISGLPAGNKYGKRGFSLSDKFGRLKRAIGFDARYVLHSIRHTVTTELIRAGVDQVVRHDILGHEHERLEERVYGHGASLKQKRAAIERLKYPKA